MQASSTSDNSAQRQTLRERGICVVIPTYNNGNTIGDVVRQCKEECDDIIVVDDGCTDCTGDVLRGIEGITVVRHKHNRGKGAALKSGFRRAKELGFAYVITLDGDGQHYPKDISNILKANQEHPGAFIIGSRNLTGVKRSGGSVFANKFSNFWFNLQTGRRISDTQSGYRLYPLNKLRLLPLVSSRYEAELSLLVFASWHGAEIYETQIDVYYPPQEERVSHFRPAADFTRISILNTILCVMAVAYGLPLTVLRMVWSLLKTAYTLIVFGVSTLLVFSPLMWLYAHIGKMTEAKKEKIHRLITNVSKLVLGGRVLPWVKFRVKVAENVDFDRPSVIVCNHQSSLDMLSILTLSHKIVFLTKDWVRRNPFFGCIVRCADYPSASEGIDELIPELKELTDKGYSIVIYPEGTRSRDLKISRFHQGAFVIAERLGLPITPATIYGSGRVMDGRKPWIRSGIIALRVDNPIDRERLDGIGNTLAQASELRKHTIETYAKIANKTEQEL